MKMSKRQYRIGELAKQLKVEKFVIRFWEKELGIKPDRSTGGQRFYQDKDFETFKTIKELLYEKKFTIAGAKAELRKRKGPSQHKVIATQKEPSNEAVKLQEENKQLKTMLAKLKGQLAQLKELL